jgi:hypothetical protein
MEVATIAEYQVMQDCDKVLLIGIQHLDDVVSGSWKK